MHLCSHFTSAAGIPLLGVGPEIRKLEEKNEKSILFVENKHKTLSTKTGGSDKMCKIDIMKHLQSNPMAPGFFSHCSSSGTSENTAG